MGAAAETGAIALNPPSTHKLSSIAVALVDTITPGKEVIVETRVKTITTLPPQIVFIPTDKRSKPTISADSMIRTVPSYGINTMIGGNPRPVEENITTHSMIGVYTTTHSMIGATLPSQSVFTPTDKISKPTISAESMTGTVPSCGVNTMIGDNPRPVEENITTHSMIGKCTTTHSMIGASANNNHHRKYNYEHQTPARKTQKRKRKK